MRIRDLLGFLLGSVLVTPLCGCAGWVGAGNLRVWALPEDAGFARDAVPEAETAIYSEATQRVHLEAAVNETIAFQVILASDDVPTRITEVAIDAFEGGSSKFPADAAQIYRQGWITADNFPSWYLRLTPNLRQLRSIPDPLIPLSAPTGALPLDVHPRQCEALWVQVHVPVGTQEGDYQSRLRLTLQTGQTRDLHVTLSVWPFALPQTRHLALITGVDTAAILRQHLEAKGKPYSPSRLTFDDPLYAKAAAIIDDTMRLLHDHRCSPMMCDVQPARRIAPNGSLELDWSDYDRLVWSIVDGSSFEDRAAAIAWPLPLSEREPEPSPFGGWGSAEYERMLAGYLRQCVAHFDQRGWLDRHYLWLPVPAANRGDRYRQFEHLGRLVREADPRINLICDLSPQSMTPYGWQEDPFIDLSALIGTWATPAGLLDPQEQARRRRAGNRTWLSPDQPPCSGSLSVIASPVDARSICWQAFRCGLGGVFLPAINDWPQDGIPRAAGSQRALLWPGKTYGLNGSIPSVRLKRLLRGAQDYEYLWLLVQNRRAAIADVIAGDLFSFGGAGCYGEHFLDTRPGGWVTDPAAWSLGRRLMARELSAALSEPISSASAPAEDAANEAFESQMEWARLAGAVRQVRASVEGVRLHLNRSPGNQPPVELEAAVSAFNATRRPFSGAITFAGLPADWRRSGEPAVVRNLPPLRSTRKIVRALAPSIAANPAGVFPLQFRIGNSNVLLPSRVCVLTSYRLARTPTIDGRLDDWPLGTTNVAADFILVGALDVPKEGRRTPDRPTLGTTVFVCDDADALYIGFNCEEDAGAPRRVSRSNAVQYDGLWPSGEDVLEVVLDPTGRAIAPGDVLHVLLKMNGVVITERGAPCLQPVAPCTPWPANIAAAIDDNSQTGRWTAEIRIPKSALGQLAPAWGINFARYNDRLGEYASWSGARQYLYSPVTLGNIALTP